MSKRLTITLTDEEYEALERDAQRERRSVREMAAYLVTRPRLTVAPYVPLTPYINPLPPTWYPSPTICKPTITTIGTGENGYTAPTNTYTSAAVPTFDLVN